MGKWVRALDRGGLTAAAIAAGGLAALLPATASAASAATQPATVSVDKACYVITSSIPSMTVTGSGFEAGGTVHISDARGKLSADTTADAAGDIAATVAAPLLAFTAPSQQRDTITATQTASTGVRISGSASTYITALGAEHGATHKEPGLRALTETTPWSFSGFPVGETIYAHYLIAGKQVALQAFGRATAPCGVLKVHKRLFPKTPTRRSYALQVDTSRRYTTDAAPKITKLKVALSLQF